MVFQSTLPVGGATGDFTGLPSDPIISIHAPRGGSDDRLRGFHQYPADFNPRSPWGERPASSMGLGLLKIFQSTLPVGGATRQFLPLCFILDISIHAPRGGSDRLANGIHDFLINFNPRSPWGERLDSRKTVGCSLIFQSTLPVGGATSFPERRSVIALFQSTLPVGGAT